MPSDVIVICLRWFFFSSFFSEKKSISCVNRREISKEEATEIKSWDQWKKSMSRTIRSTAINSICACTVEFSLIPPKSGARFASSIPHLTHLLPHAINLCGELIRETGARSLWEAQDNIEGLIAHSRGRMKHDDDEAGTAKFGARMFISGGIWLAVSCMLEILSAKSSTFALKDNSAYQPIDPPFSSLSVTWQKLKKYFGFNKFLLAELFWNWDQTVERINRGNINWAILNL